MADLDHLYDFKGKISNYIAEQIAELFATTPNEHNYPAWLQATLLFHEVVVPCDYYPTDELIELAKKLVLACVDHKFKGSNSTDFLKLREPTLIENSKIVDFNH